MQPRDLSAHEAYVPGRGIEEVARELGRDPAEFVKLASNENPHGPSPKAVDRIREVAGSINLYPTSGHADLREELADRWGVAPEQVWLGNGADGALDCLARATIEPGDRVLVPDPGFAYYPMSARYHHGEVATYPLTDDLEVTPDAVLEAYDGERVVYLTTPHNPTGSTLALGEVERIAEGTGEETLVIVDEAYGEFSSLPSAVSAIGGDPAHRPDAAGESPEFEGSTPRDDLAVVRTFSKAYGLAGIRLGYAVVPEPWAEAYAKINTPFAAGELSCRAGLAALDDDEHVRRTVETARRTREYMREAIDAPVHDSESNFVLVDVGDAGTVTDRLQHEGVIVRDCTSFGLPGHVRITCGTDEETERAVGALNEVLADLAGGPEGDPGATPNAGSTPRRGDGS